MGGQRRHAATVARMPIDLDQPDKPKHVQLADYLRARIDDGTYPPRSRIPSELTLTQETGLARDTVRKAVQVLIGEGRLYIVRGMGTFVKGLQVRPVAAGHAVIGGGGGHAQVLSSDLAGVVEDVTAGQPALDRHPRDQGRRHDLLGGHVEVPGSVDRFA